MLLWFIMFLINLLSIITMYIANYFFKKKGIISIKIANAEIILALTTLFVVIWMAAVFTS